MGFAGAHRGPRVAGIGLAAVLWLAPDGLAALGAPQPPQAAPARGTPAARLDQAFELAYNLDHEPAVAAMRAIIAETPSDPAPHRALATVTWLHLLFRRGLVLVEHYLGPVSKENVKLPPPPADAARTFHEHVTKAIALAEARVKQKPDDPAALYELGNAVGLQASWAATIEGKVMGAFGSARRAYNSHERVLALAPARKDAALIVGTYRYVVGSLSLPARWMAYVVGFGGDKEYGLRLLREAAGYPTTATDARFALVLLLNREGRYDQAVPYVRDLQRRYPRNRLLWLEEGSTLLRGGRAGEAESALTSGITMLQRDARPRMFGEDGLWYFKRGEARIRMGRAREAADDLNKALTVESQAWVKGRTHLELGKAADLEGRRADAQAAYDRCLQLCAAANDQEAVQRARQLKRQPYRVAAPGPRV